MWYNQIRKPRFPYEPSFVIIPFYKANVFIRTSCFNKKEIQWETPHSLFPTCRNRTSDILITIAHLQSNALPTELKLDVSHTGFEPMTFLNHYMLTVLQGLYRTELMRQSVRSTLILNTTPESGRVVQYMCRFFSK